MRLSNHLFTTQPSHLACSMGKEGKEDAKASKGSKKGQKVDDTKERDLVNKYGRSAINFSTNTKHKSLRKTLEVVA